MLHSLTVFFPLVLLLLMAFLTKRIAESLFCATLLSLVLVYGSSSFQGIIDTLYETLSNSSYQYVLLILLLFGPVIALLKASGALSCFGSVLERYAYGKKRPLIVAWGLCLLLFVDEYMSALTVSHALRPVTDKNGIPREHLAMQNNAMAASIAVLVPFTSWTAFSVSLIRPYGMDFSDYIRAVPTMFFPMFMILCVLLLALGVVPKVGKLKAAYRRVDDGGSPAPHAASGAGSAFSGDARAEAVSNEGETLREARLYHLFLPILLLLIGLMLPGRDLLRGLILALVCQFVLYVLGRRMSARRFTELFFEGAGSVLEIAIIIGIGFTFCSLNEKLGTFEQIINAVGSTLPPSLLPLAAFLTVGFLTFTTGESWVMQVIAMPVFIPMALENGGSVPLVLSAIMSGISLGYCLCFYADAVLMTSGATEVPSVDISKTSIPYALSVALVSSICFALLGILG